MTKLDVSIKHSGKTHPVVLDTDLPPAVFKEAIRDATGVPVERMKVMIKGGMLKDDTDWKRVNPKSGQSFTVIGTAEALPAPPSKPILFLEDMDESDLAKVQAMPVGLVNMGNTCYMNASLQVMRAIPELKDALTAYPPGGSGMQAQLTTGLRDLYDSMDKTIEGVTPLGFLRTLRQVVPQFNEFARGPMAQGYAQQDADECWTEVVNTLRQSLNSASVPSDEEGSSTVAVTPGRFVDQYMLAELTEELKCDEAPDEPAITKKEKVIQVDCNITISTNYLMSGIMDSLDQKIEKHSPSLDRNAVYTKHSRFSRLPNNLTVHMVRFYWRNDINKKAKIMRRVKFPFELDALDLCTPDLKAKLSGVNSKMKEVDRDRRERRKVRRKTKKAAEVAATADVEMTPVPAEPSTEEEAVTVTELEEEPVYRKRELDTLEKLVDPSLREDKGASVSGLYDLCGIVTHKGASADSGHYMGFVRKDAFHPSDEGAEDEDEIWYKFDDDKVSAVRKEQIVSLEGGGEDSVAYILLYRGRSLS